MSSAREAAPSSDFESVWTNADRIDGWLSRGQAAALYRAAASVPATSWIVEIGSHHGRSTVVLARARSEGVGLLAVDPFDDQRWGGGVQSYQRFQENMRATGVAVSLYRGTSAQAAENWRHGAVGLLFVDGAHDRRSVLADIDGWEPYVAEGGLVYFHDAFSSIGVTLALLQRHALNRSFVYTGSVRSLAMFKRQDASIPASLRSSARLICRLPWFARNVAVKLAMAHGPAGLSRLLGHKEEGFPF